MKAMGGFPGPPWPFLFLLFFNKLNLKKAMAETHSLFLLIATSEGEVERNLLYLKKLTGQIIIDSPNGGPDSIDAKGIAHQMGNPRAANIVLLGYAIAKLKVFDPQIFEEPVVSLSPASFSELNLEAFRTGFKMRII